VPPSGRPRRSPRTPRSATPPAGPQAWPGVWAVWAPAGARAGRPGGHRGAARVLPALRRRAAGGAHRLPVPAGPAAATGWRDDLLPGADRPLWWLRAAGAAAPSHPDLGCAGCGWGAARAAGGRAGGMVQQGAGAVGGQGCPAAGPVRGGGDPGGVVQAVARAARRAQPTYAALVEGVKASPVVAPDETGWRVGGRRAWLWAFAGQGITVYRIAAIAASRTPRRCWGKATRGCWSATGGRRTASSPLRSIRAAWRICCAGSASCWPTPSAGRPRPPCDRPDPPAGALGPRRP
jgi:hypothetical protein